MVEVVRNSPFHRPGERIRQQDHTTAEPRRYMSIISAPYFFSSAQSADWGYFCTRCQESIDPATFFRIKFTKDGIIEHLKWHGVKMLTLSEPSMSDRPTISISLLSSDT
ncbi:hypothetical protein F4825DRAFT_440788 [Nemania diffusa]|nr:hypothetical protein F4825DRAFT_440788 [Nemania diffusa]